MIDSGTCPLCGLRKEQWQNLIPTSERTLAHGEKATDKLDRLMNRVVGALLIASIAALVALQTYFPR